MNFPERLKYLRKYYGYTQSTLAEKLGVTQGTVAMWETGKRTPDYDTLKVLSEYFDRSADYILGFSEDDSLRKAAEMQRDKPKEPDLPNEQMDILRRYLRLDAYGRERIRAAIQQEENRCSGKCN
ncbi:MAG: helix-turn-helix transcriptional regulator [Lachnospiraceae bacterium]|nr:helix-turn-helix transcriptional regulator [Lachnospiraceae bacterium]